MKVSECMTRNVQMVSPEMSIQEAAKIMLQIDAGALPVHERDQLIGIITDRDIVIRAVCEGKGPDTSIREIMSRDVKYCFDDQEIGEVAKNMADIQLRRLPVVNRDKRLVGILALGDIANAANDQTAGEAITGVSRSA
ncbi:CBS domain-containing protein [Pseudomonas luteola]